VPNGSLYGTGGKMQAQAEGKGKGQVAGQPEGCRPVVSVAVSKTPEFGIVLFAPARDRATRTGLLTNSQYPVYGGVEAALRPQTQYGFPMMRCCSPRELLETIRVLSRNKAGQAMCVLSETGTKLDKTGDIWRGCVITSQPGVYPTTSSQRPRRSGDNIVPVVCTPLSDMQASQITMTGWLVENYPGSSASQPQ